MAGIPLTLTLSLKGRGEEAAYFARMLLPNSAYQALLQGGFLREEGTPKTCFLRNEAICNVEEMASILVEEKELHRLRENDKWLRFPGNEGRSLDMNTPHINPLPYTTTACRRTPLPPRGEA